MKKYKIFALILACLLLISGCKQPPQAESTSVEAVYPEKKSPLKKVSDDMMPADFYKKSAVQFIGAESGNAVYSPFSAYIALSMLAECAEGDTQEQILKVLNSENVSQNTKIAKEYLYSSIDNKSKAATSLWTDGDFDYNGDTVETLKSDLLTSVYSVDFESAETSSLIRDWINKNTADLLTQSAEGVEFDSQTSIALISTLYFDSLWQDEFDKDDTAPATFYAKGESYDTDFMNRLEKDSKLYTMSDCTAVSRRFSNDCRMVFILPNDDKTVADVLNSGDYYNALADNAYTARYDINLSVPKFNIENSINMIDGLKALGVTDAFSPENANLSAIGLKGHWINKFDQLARVEVNEDSVKAASAIIIGGTWKGESEVLETIDFTLNRPFLFAITTHENIPLFVGVVNNP